MNLRDQKPRVSVCIVTYNQERYIKDCLLGVLAQAYDVDLQVLVGDDASTDNTSIIVQDIAKKHQNIIHVFRHEKNLGANLNAQFLIDRATGEYIAHLDGDDFWMPGKLEAQVAFLEKNTECLAVYSNAVLIDENKKILGAFNKPQPDSIDINYLLAKGNFLNNSSMLYRQWVKSLLQEKPIPFIDYQLHIRIALKGKIGYLNQMLVAYRVGGTNSLTSVVPEKVQEYSYKSISEAKATVNTDQAYASYLSDVLYVSVRSFRYKLGTYWIQKMYSEDDVINFRVIYLSMCFLVYKLTVGSVFKLMQHIVGFRILSRR